jgi:outer membrane protein assembly factor BamB
MARAERRLVAAATALIVLAACAEKELILPGERFDPRAPLAASVPLEGAPVPVDTTGEIANQSRPLALPPVTAGAGWTQRSANARHLPPHAALSGTPARLFAVDIGAGNSRRARITAQPVVDGGRVYVMDALGTVSAVSAGGALLWQTGLRPAEDRSEISGGGLAVAGGRLFATTGYGELVALDGASGGILWRHRLGAPAGGAPSVEGGTVYAAGRDAVGWALDAETGRVRWSLDGTPAPGGAVGAAAPAVGDTAVIFAFSSGEIGAALKDTGVRLWTAVLAGERRGRAYAGIDAVTGEPAIAGDVTFVGSQAGRTVALETASGRRLWTAREGAAGTPLAVGDALFQVTDDARLARLDAGTGETVWAVELPYFAAEKARKRQAITAHFGPVLASGRLVVVSGDEVIRFFNPESGASLGGVELPSGAAAPPALAGGVLYVVTQNGQLQAFR